MTVLEKGRGRNAHLTEMTKWPQPYATVSAAARTQPDILCRFPEPGNDNPYSARHASGDCPLRVVPESREFIGCAHRDRARAGRPDRLVDRHRGGDAGGARDSVALPARSDRPDALRSGAEGDHR